MSTEGAQVATPARTRVGSPAGIELWTDGACKGNPGPGGWGAILLRPDQPAVELSGYEPATTNNRMELTAVIEGLRHLPNRSASVTVHTDSQLVVKGMTEWIGGWQRKNWRKSDGDPVLNAELWQALLVESQRLGQVRWQWVRGHSGVPLNERADQLAVQAIERRGASPSSVPGLAPGARSLAPRDAAAARAAHADALEAALAPQAGAGGLGGPLAPHLVLYQPDTYQI